MKMRKWLSRAVVLAMVLAMMIPMPVMAKSSDKGGKLVKSVTYYDYNAKTNAYRAQRKVSFTYDSKGNPSEIQEAYYNDWFLGIPTKASIDEKTLAYKYKGGKAKSMTMKNSAGYVTDSRKYKNGKVVSYASNGAPSTGYWDWETDEWKETGKENSYKESGSVAYDKSGLVKATCAVTTDIDEGVVTSTTEYNDVYYVTSKNGLPTYAFNSASNYKRTDSKGNVTFEQSDGSGMYWIYNSKGLVTQYGWYDAKTNKYDPYANIQYVMKKGKVAEAVVLYIENGKESIGGKAVFEYTKTKASKQRYSNMVNNLTHTGYASFWY